MIIVWLIIYCFMSRSRICHWYEDVTITGEGLQNLGLCSAFRAFLYHATPAVTRGLGFSGFIQSPFTTHRGCGGPILNQILSGRFKLIMDERTDASTLVIDFLMCPTAVIYRVTWLLIIKLEGQDIRASPFKFTTDCLSCIFVTKSHLLDF
jgi:hypothetical protein